jgi:AraC-like DNA-binding protein
MTIEAEISGRFHVPAPTVLSPVGKSPPLALSHLYSFAANSQKSTPARPEDGYAMHIMLCERTSVQLWVNGREIHIPPVFKGGVMMEHLETTPAVGFKSGFDFIRLYVSKASLDEVAEGVGLARPDGLRRPEYGARDPILYHLAAAVAPLIQREAAGDQLLLDHIALAFQTHLLSAHGGAPLDAWPSRRNLAPWLERRAKEFIDANLARRVSLSEVAEQCGLSTSHFSRAFRKTTGRPPHRWLLERRVGAAKTMLAAGALSLAQIAADCGFSDASHFSRVFSKVVGEPPAVWRRSNRR